ncbi:Wzz/FepE/Etk N-terminal domain-containing protein [Spirosoma telluris]|uniref:Wzz/FepE/Etk N-terminal domain-containing protein n=1 Tax=Spirosoma telluris TaxID=2183553 RepID=UPI002FC3B5DF
MSVTETTRKPNGDGNEIEIRLSDIIRFLKNNRRRFLIGAFVGMVIGAVYAFAKPNVYTAQVTVMPEIQSRAAGSLGELGSLAGLAGINLDNTVGQDAIRPDLYPTILQSIPFALHLLNQPVYSQKLQATMRLQDFMERMERDSFFGRIIHGLLGNKGEEAKLDPKNFSQAIQITKDQQELIKSVYASAGAIYDKKTGILTLTAVEQDPVVAATVARLSLEYLTKYITAYRTEKASQQVTFLMQQVQQTKRRYQAAESALAAYKDRNRSLLLNTAKIDEQRLQSDYLLEQSVYNELSKQLEQAKIKVQEETPFLNYWSHLPYPY